MDTADKEQLETVVDGDAPLESSENDNVEIEAQEGVELQESEVTEQEPKGGVPISEHVKLRKKKQEAEQELEQLRRDKEAMQQERDLALLSLGDPKPQETGEILPPNPDDYFGDAEGYKNAFNEWNKHNTQQIVNQVQSLQDEKFTAQQQADQNAKTKQESDAAQQAFYEKADKLGVDDFLQAEEHVQKAWSPEFYRQVIAEEGSERLIYALYKDPDPEKALSLALTFDQKGALAGTKALLDYATKHSQIKTGGDTLPEPDEPIQGGAGGGGGSIDSEISKLYDKVSAGTMSFDDMRKQKAELIKRRAA